MLSLPPFLYFYHIQQSVLYMAKLYLNCENSFYTKTRINNNFITYQIDMSSHKVIEYFRDNKIAIDNELPYNWHNTLKSMQAIYTKDNNENIYFLKKTKCTICSKEVYYFEKKHKSGKISKVFFDSLGPEWNVHPCMKEIQDSNYKNILINDNIPLFDFLYFCLKYKVDRFILRLSMNAMNRGIDEISKKRPGTSIFINEVIGYMSKYKKEYARYIYNFCIEYGPFVPNSDIKGKIINVCGEDIILENPLRFSFDKYKKMENHHNIYAFKEFKLPKNISNINKDVNHILYNIKNFSDSIPAGYIIFFDTKIKVDNFIDKILENSINRTLQEAAIPGRPGTSEYANTIILYIKKIKGDIFAQNIRAYYLNNGPFVIPDKNKILHLNGNRVELEKYFAVQFSSKKYEKNYSAMKN